MVYRRKPYLVKPSPHNGKNSSNKQREMTVIITLRHEGHSIWNISSSLNVSSSAVAKPIKCYDETGSHEERHRNGRPRVSFAEGTFIRVTSLRNCSPNKCFRVQVTYTSQHQLFWGDCVNQAFMVKLLQRNHY